jgi:hypothetical protein
MRLPMVRGLSLCEEGEQDTAVGAMNSEAASEASETAEAERSRAHKHRKRKTVRGTKENSGTGWGPRPLSIYVYRDWPAIVLRTIWVNQQ